MSLNEWSLVYFTATLIFMIMQVLSLFTKLTFGKVFFTIIAWVIFCGVTLAYGIATNQLGFIMLFVAQLLMVLIMFIFYGKAVNGNQES